MARGTLPHSQTKTTLEANPVRLSPQEEHMSEMTQEEATRAKGMATWSLVLGVLSLLCFGPLAGIPGWILAVKAKKKLRAAGQPTGTATAGHALSGIGTLAWAVVFLVVAMSQDGRRGFWEGLESKSGSANSQQKEHP